MPEMKNPDPAPSDAPPETPHPARVARATCRAGELYLFHCTDPQCPPATSLWGVFDRDDDKRLHLESSSCDLHSFRRWHALPEAYRYRRLATREELRDYTWNLACADLLAGSYRKHSFSR